MKQGERKLAKIGRERGHDASMAHRSQTLHNKIRDEIRMNNAQSSVVSDNNGDFGWARVSQTPVALPSLCVCGDGSPRAWDNGVGGGRVRGILKSTPSRLSESPCFCGNLVAEWASTRSSTPHAPTPLRPRKPAAITPEEGPTKSTSNHMPVLLVSNRTPAPSASIRTPVHAVLNRMHASSASNGMPALSASSGTSAQFC